MKTQKTLVIFDCDGVLIDSEKIYLEVEFAFLEAKGVRVATDWYIDNFMALANQKWRGKLSDLLIEQTGQPLTDADYEALKAQCRSRVLAELEVVSGVAAMLDSLTAAKCVASSTQMQFLPGKLQRTGLDGYFGDAVFSGDQVENGKPAPDLFLFAAATMGFAPKDCIVVEDSTNGVLAGKAAGMRTIGFTGGSHAGPRHVPRLLAAGADHVVHDHGQLARWLNTSPS